MTPNRYKVVKEQWAKWTETARATFDDTYRTMRDNQRLFTHPKAEQVSAKLWATTCWNAAWWAADEVTKREKARKAPNLAVVQNALDEIGKGLKRWSPTQRRLYERATAQIRRAA